MKRQHDSRLGQPESQASHHRREKEGTDIRTGQGGNQSPGSFHHQEEENPEREHKIDDQLDQSFPASDPPSYSQPGNTLEEDK